MDFTPVKLSYRVGPVSPEWIAEWSAPSGLRLCGYGQNPGDAMLDLARQSMDEEEGKTPTMSAQAAEHLTK